MKKLHPNAVALPRWGKPMDTVGEISQIVQAAPKAVQTRRETSPEFAALLRGIAAKGAKP